MKLALNCARVAGTEILDRAAAKGLARVLDLPGPAARCWAAAAAFAKADASARVVARVGYFAAQDGRIAHSLAADRVAAEVERCAELLGRPLDAALLHGPEEVPPAAQRAQVRIVDGQLVVAEPQAPEESAPEVEEEGLIEVRGDDAPGATSASYSNRVPSERWGLEETRRFYDALRRFGTDFTMMLTAFPGRTQRQLKNKFKRENRTQSALVSLALDASIAADLTAPLVIEAAPVEKPSSRQITYGPDAGVFLFDPALDAEKDLKPV